MESYRGQWSGQMGHRCILSLMMQTLGFFFFIFWRAGGLMLIGMALYRWGVFSARRSTRFYLALLAAGVLIGIPLCTLGVQAGWSGRLASAQGQVPDQPVELLGQHLRRPGLGGGDHAAGPQWNAPVAAARPGQRRPHGPVELPAAVDHVHADLLRARISVSSAWSRTEQMLLVGGLGCPTDLVADVVVDVPLRTGRVVVEHVDVLATAADASSVYERMICSCSGTTMPGMTMNARPVARRDRPTSRRWMGMS